MNWPKTLSEDETLDAAIAGVSLARFGDGELNLIFGGKCVTQTHSRVIAEALREILHNRIPGLLIGIPRMEGPKVKFWQQFDKPQVHRLLGKGRYASAFVTRPDSAPWIDRKDYWQKLRRLWAGKTVTLVRGSGKSLTAPMLYDAHVVREVIVPKRNAFYDYDFIRGQIGTPKRVLLCCGPTATILAYDLCKCGVHAVDLGHIGMFLRKHIVGEPMVVTEDDKRVDQDEMAG